MTMNVAPERSTLSLPGARLRAEGGQARVGAEQPAPREDAGRGPIQISREAPAAVAELRSLLTGLDRASSVADVALVATDAIKGFLQELREESVAARTPGAKREQAFATLVDRIGEQVSAAGFGGVNLLDGSIASGILRLPASTQGEEDVSLTAQDMRPGGPLILVTADADPATSLAAVETSMVNVRAAAEDLRDEARRMDTHRAFLGMLSDAVTGGPAPSLDAEGARLAALQVRQALSGQPMSVSNAAPQAVLSLFR